MIEPGERPAAAQVALSEAEIANEIRVVQSVQMQSYLPVLIMGNAYMAIAVLINYWYAAKATGAAYALGLEVLLLLPVLYSYLHLRGRPRPERVSSRRIRSIANYSLVMGMAWAAFFFLITPQLSRPEGLTITTCMFILIFGAVAFMPSLPRATLTYVGPIMFATFTSAYRHDLVALDWLVLLMFGTLAGVLLPVRQNWVDLQRSVRLRLENLHNQKRTEQAKEVLERVSEKLRKYISPQLYQAILRGDQDVAIESKRKKLTIFFSDIAGFTEITDQLESEELTALLNEYLTEMAKIAQEYGANFDKFIGDAIVLYFGDPETKGVKEDAADCVRMAIAMQRRMQELQQKWRDAGLERPFEIRIGINTGYCTVGNFGNEDRMDYTIIGGEVNLASRLEYEAEVGGILLANETYQLVKDWVMAEKAQILEVKGFPRPIKTFSVKGIYDELEAEGRVIHHDQEGLNLTIERDKLGDEGQARAVEILTKALEQIKD